MKKLFIVLVGLLIQSEFVLGQEAKNCWELGKVDEYQTMDQYNLGFEVGKKHFYENLWSTVGIADLIRKSAETGLSKNSECNDSPQSSKRYLDGFEDAAFDEFLIGFDAGYDTEAEKFKPTSRGGGGISFKE